MPLSETLFFSALSSIIFFILGGIIGWMGNDVVYAVSTKDQAPEYQHPEMYDSNGTPYSGELLTLHFDEVEDQE